MGKKNNQNGKNIWKWKKENMYRIKIGGHITCPFSRKGQGGLWRVVLCLNSGLALLCCPNYKHYKLLLLLCCCPNYKTTFKLFYYLHADTFVSHQLFFYNYFFTCNVVDTFYLLLFTNIFISESYNMSTPCWNLIENKENKKYCNKKNQKNLYTCEKIKSFKKLKKIKMANFVSPLFRCVRVPTEIGS